MRSGWLGFALAASLAAGAAQAEGDGKVEALVKRAQDVARQARSLEAEIVGSHDLCGRKSGGSGTVRLLKPNYGDMQMTETDRKSVRIISTGKHVFTVFSDQSEYTKLPVAEASSGPGRLSGPAGLVFFHPDTWPRDLLTGGTGLLHSKETGTLTYAGTETVEGRSYEVVRQSFAMAPEISQKIYFGATGLPEGAVSEINREDAKIKRQVWLKNIRLNAPLKPQQFAYTPPAGLKEEVLPELGARMLKVGDRAPSFQLPTPDGREVSLEKSLKGKKAVLINFWFHG